MNKRGQLDKALAALPVFFLVFLIVLLFVLLSLGALGVLRIKGTAEHIALNLPIQMPVLFDSVRVIQSDKTVQHITVLEDFLETQGVTNQETPGAAATDLNTFEQRASELTPKNGCLVFLWQSLPALTPQEGFISKDAAGSITIVKNSDPAFDNLKNIYDAQNLLENKQISLAANGRQYEFATYKGACANA